ncbi:MAG: phytanoyl-CoA dioxygenase family protein [Alphaproteobacteria bacterium TMED89]|nr:phytanoyl-CoA dioxygenase [Rhodospirillaceae bacterium]RPH12319.1 MAG: phytanoyl-CoA dioxygenase family protein [Alphaproteobacteria bacterium TMED89]
MPKRLTVDQQESYARDGFVAPIDIFSADEVAEIRAEIEAAEARWPNALDGAGRNNGHLALPVLDRIVHDSRVLDAVEDVIGGDILAAGSTLFIKEPHSGGFISWHQDARYAGMEPHNWVTGWVAISNVTEENGCMQMIPGSHIDPLRDHVDTFGENNLLTRGQEVQGIDEGDAVAVPLKPGQMSLHHPRIVHGSGPNQSNERRIGFALQSYIASTVEQVLGDMYVQHARGTDGPQHHLQAPRVREAMSDEAVALRIDANKKLADILYAGSERMGKY